MAINQTKIFDDLEKLTKNNSSTEFIYDFLKIFDFPKATITRLKKDDNPLNIADNPKSGEVGIKQSLYFKPVDDSCDVYEELIALRESDVVKTHKIRFCIVANNNDFAAYDQRYADVLECGYTDLFKNYTFFLPLLNIERSREFFESYADVKASEKMGRLFDAIKLNNRAETKEDVHALNVFMSRLLFCFFAEDTNIFEKNIFTSTLESFTEKNGANFAEELAKIFAIMNEPDDSELRKSVPTHIAKFPYVNGGLFESTLPIPKFTGRTRRVLLECGYLEWSEINPDIFGSMFQAVIDPAQRRNHGQHYTSVPNIMKTIQPLFVEPLEDELKNILSKKDVSRRKKALHEFSMRLGQAKFLDPACGSGNYLIISYKELRRIEMDVFKALREIDSNSMFYSAIHLNQFYGIEIDDFAHEIATLSLWLAEHQMNVQFKALFGDCTPTLPLKQSGNVVCGNSLRLDWNEVLPRKSKEDEVYVIGNPPFGGKQDRDIHQSEDMEIIFEGNSKLKILDYVSCWFMKGASYIQDSAAKLSLVATNSIVQGEQVSALWPQIFEKDISISFAYKPFVWRNNAKHNAAVHVSIISLSANQYLTEPKKLFDDLDGKTHIEEVDNISPYLTKGENSFVVSRGTPLCNVPKMAFGNMPNEGGNLILNPAEKDDLLAREPAAEKWLKKLIGAEEFLNGKDRWCLWLEGITEQELDELPLTKQRVEQVRKFRSESKRKETRELSNTPHLFGEIRQDSSLKNIVIPCHSSERREYLPIGLLDQNYITTNANLLIPNGGVYELGIMMSAMHNEWMRVVCGRLKSDFRYSASVVYNCFPWPEVSADKKAKIEALAEEVLLIRADYPDKTLAQLYDPNLMPEPLLDAHKALDAAVDRLYRTKAFTDGSDRVSHLFALYDELIKREADKTSIKSKS